MPRGKTSADKIELANISSGNKFLWNNAEWAIIYKNGEGLMAVSHSGKHRTFPMNTPVKPFSSNKEGEE